VWVQNDPQYYEIEGESLCLLGQMQFQTSQETFEKHRRNSGCRHCTKNLKTVLESGCRVDSKLFLKFLYDVYSPSYVDFCMIEYERRKTAYARAGAVILLSKNILQSLM